MKFSVITITFNAENYLAKSLESVSRQQGVEFEHLLWDGGSTDKTLEIARSFPHLKIHTGSDKGIADAMNRGAALAQGEFLIHLHADDCLLHSKVLLQMAHALKVHPKSRWIYGRAKMIDENDAVRRETPFEPFSWKRLCKYNFITHPSVAVSRALFERVGGFDPALKYCMDYDLWLRLAKIAEPLALSNLFSCFREHTGSLSTSHPCEVADEAYSVRKRYVRGVYPRFRSYLSWKKRKRDVFFS